MMKMIPGPLEQKQNHSLRHSDTGWFSHVVLDRLIPALYFLLHTNCEQRKESETRAELEKQTIQRAEHTKLHQV